MRLKKKKKKVNVYRWHDENSINGNFGDEITLPVLKQLFSLEPVPCELHRAELIGAGSILEHYWTFLSIQNKKDRKITERAKRWLERSSILHVWGTGTLFNDKPVTWPQKLQVHAVRGALTANRLCKDAANIPMGDPGILASLLIDPPQQKRWAVAIVPNHVDTTYLSNLDLPKSWRLIDPEQPVLDVVHQIASADLVISSSLHGLIVADAFKIPCIWAESHTRLQGTEGHKFNDYMTSRPNAFNRPVSYQVLLNLKHAKLEDIATIASRDIEEWQNNLIEVFPFR